MSEALPSKTKKISFGCGTFAFTVGTVEDEPVELFLHLGKNGSCSKCLLEGISRLIGLALRNGIPLNEVCDELSADARHNGLACNNGAWYGGDFKTSCLDALGKELRTYSWPCLPM